MEEEEELELDQDQDQDQESEQEIEPTRSKKRVGAGYLLVRPAPMKWTKTILAPKARKVTPITENTGVKILMMVLK